MHTVKIKDMLRYDNCNKRNKRDKRILQTRSRRYDNVHLCKGTYTYAGEVRNAGGDIRTLQRRPFDQRQIHASIDHKIAYPRTAPSKVERERIARGYEDVRRANWERIKPIT